MNLKKMVEELPEREMARSSDERRASALEKGNYGFFQVFKLIVFKYFHP